jgi:hypothetical protein
MSKPEKELEQPSLSRTREAFNFLAPFTAMSMGELLAMQALITQENIEGSAWPLLSFGLIFINYLASFPISEYLNNRHLNKHR